MADGWWREEGRKESSDVLWWWWRRGGLSAHASVVTKQSLDFPFIFFLHDFSFILEEWLLVFCFFLWLHIGSS
jgi:hypothetical protein